MMSSDLYTRALTFTYMQHNAQTDKHEVGKGHSRTRVTVIMATDIGKWGNLPIALVLSQLTDPSLASSSQMVLAPHHKCLATQRT